MSVEPPSERLLCSRTQLRELFGGISQTRLTQFINEGMPKAITKGTYDVILCVQWWMERKLRHQTQSKRKTQTDYYNEVARLKYLERRRLEGELLEITGVEQLLGAIGTGFAEFAESFPSRVSEELSQLADIDDIEAALDRELDEARNLLAGEIETFEFKEGVFLEPEAAETDTDTSMDGGKQTPKNGLTASGALAQ